MTVSEAKIIQYCPSDDPVCSFSVDNRHGKKGGGPAHLDARQKDRRKARCTSDKEGQPISPGSHDIRGEASLHITQEMYSSPSPGN